MGNGPGRIPPHSGEILWVTGEDLIYAARNCDEAAVRRCLEANVDVDYRENDINNRGGTALCSIPLQHHTADEALSIVTMLLAAGADANIQNAGFNTPLSGCPMGDRHSPLRKIYDMLDDRTDVEAGSLYRTRNGHRPRGDALRRAENDQAAKENDLRTWLAQKNLEELCEALEAGGVTKDDLPYVTPWDLEAMGIQPFKARRLLGMVHG